MEKYWLMKRGSIGPTTIYLGNKVSKVTLENGVHAWAFSSAQYVKAAVSNVERMLKLKEQQLPRRASTPLSTGYQPEIDVSKELSSAESAYYMSLIGILRWIVDLVRIDLTCETSMMASMMANPRRGHIDELFHMFGYLKLHHNVEIIFDPTVPDFDIEEFFPRRNWASTPYIDAKEDLPTRVPEPCGLGFTILANVDSDHAGDEVTRQSRTGFIIFLNNAPIY